MIIPDVNLLVYAYNAEDPQHEQARKWWESMLKGDEPIGLTWVVVSGYIRLMTHPRVLMYPISSDLVLSHVRTWLEQPAVFILEPGKRFPEIFFGLIEQVGFAGNLTTDAWLAALAIEYQAELQSNDADFSRYSGLRWRNPL